MLTPCCATQKLLVHGSVFSLPPPQAEQLSEGSLAPLGTAAYSEPSRVSRIELGAPEALVEGVNERCDWGATKAGGRK